MANQSFNYFKGLINNWMCKKEIENFRGHSNVIRFLPNFISYLF